MRCRRQKAGCSKRHDIARENNCVERDVKNEEASLTRASFDATRVSSLVADLSAFLSLSIFLCFPSVCLLCSRSSSRRATAEGRRRGDARRLRLLFKGDRQSLMESASSLHPLPASEADGESFTCLRESRLHGLSICVSVIRHASLASGISRRSPT